MLFLTSRSSDRYSGHVMGFECLPPRQLSST
jgi:hypothetical protein